MSAIVMADQMTTKGSQTMKTETKVTHTPAAPEMIADLERIAQCAEWAPGNETERLALIAKWARARIAEATE